MSRKGKSIEKLEPQWFQGLEGGGCACKDGAQAKNSRGQLNLTTELRAGMLRWDAGTSKKGNRVVR